MSNCSRHKKDLFGESDMKVVAEAIGDLHYETLANLFGHLKHKLNEDAKKDYNAGRKKIAAKLNNACVAMRSAEVYINSAWEISKPFMQA